MKAKTINAIYILILTIGTIFSLYIPKNETVAERNEEKVVIPDEAIRLRILANSDSDKDQEIKRQVRDAVNEAITEWVEDLTSLEDARKLMQSRLPEIQKLAEGVLKEEKIQQDIQVDFGMVEFPTKLYGEYLYPAGEYEAILITIGEGKGANWWCVLFPPLCFLDFSNGTAVSEGIDEKEKPQEENQEQLSEEETVPPLKETTEESLSEREEPEIEIEVSIVEKKIEKEESADSDSEEETDEDVKQPALEANGEKSGADKEEPEGDYKQEAAHDEPLYVDEENEEVEVKFFVVELFQNIFS